jgi:hypothetical protein
MSAAKLSRGYTDLAPSIAEYDRLRDRESVIKVAKCIELPILLLDRNEELFDAFKRQFITLDKNPDWIGHKLGCHLENIIREGGTEDNNLGGRGEISVHVVDLILKPFVKELISLVKHEHFDITRAKVTPTNHIKDSTGCPRDDVLAIVKFSNVLPY